MSKTEMEYFHKIAKSTGVKNPKWSGLVKKSDIAEEKTEKEKSKKISKL